MNEPTYKALKEARRLLSQHATGDTLPDMARDLVNRHIEAIRQRDEQVLIRGRAQQAEAAALEALGAMRHRADVAEYALKSANESNAKFLHEIDELRTQVARLSAQLDYATELCLAGFRQ